MRYLSENFWTHYRDVLHCFQMNANFLFFCQSVSWLTSLQILNKYMHIICSDWDIFLNFFLKHICNVCTLFPNHCKFPVCLSVYLLGYFLTDSRQKKGYLLTWMRYLSEIFGDVFFHQITQVLQWRSCRPLVLFWYWANIWKSNIVFFLHG